MACIVSYGQPRVDVRNNMKRLLLFNLLLILNLLAFAVAGKRLKPLPVKSYSESHNCVLNEDLRDEIASYGTVVRDIIDFVTDGDFKGRTYDE